MVPHRPMLVEKARYKGRVQDAAGNKPAAARYTLDPGLLVVHVPEELVQAVGLVELGATRCGHALDALEAAVDGLTLVLHLGGVEGTAGHQAVSLAVQVLQAVLGWGKGCELPAPPLCACAELPLQAYSCSRDWGGGYWDLSSRPSRESSTS